ncbi:hypothetical protein DFR29_11014 [Tahibacter aquaticus]|uniref:DUF1440 domain-containing protein n=1 Tax=Tahibacter aquaticus TaxID=520092 RepID=A0A4R6YT29_9GAMM|nr:hypothetical protein [Tahibacter aquaticus]TDR41533.1 hypothetical protein DFR29_11014 [Tahibacter aquaticus]
MNDRHSPLRTIFLAGTVSATIDIVYACSFHYFNSGTSPLRILQAIASGILGPAAFDGGNASAALGLAAHYFILIVAAGLYYAVSQRLPLLLDRAYACGLLFGGGIWLTMNYIVLPLSAAPAFKGGSALGFWSNLAVHVLLLGPAIALVLRRHRRRDSAVTLRR